MTPLHALFGYWCDPRTQADYNAALMQQPLQVATATEALRWLYQAQRSAFSPPIRPLDERFADFKRRLDAAVAKRRRK